MLARHSRIGVVSTTLLFVFLPGLAWAGVSTFCLALSKADSGSRK
jgi:hypothetical protein